MKKKFKFLVNHLLCFSFIISLFLFPVHASSHWFYPGTRNLLSDFQQDYYCSNKVSIDSASFVFVYSDSGEFAWGFVTSGNNYKYYRMTVSGDWINNGDNKSGFPSDSNNFGAIYKDSGNYLGKGVIDNLSVLNSGCSVTPDPTPTPEVTPTPTPEVTPTPTPEVTPSPGGSDGWKADFSNILSNASVSDLVGYAYDNSIDSWYINYAVYRTPNGLSGYTTKTMGYKYFYRLYDSNGNLLRSVVSDEISGIECNNNDSSVCRPLIAYTVEIVNDTVLRSSWLKSLGTVEVNDSKGNELIESGNSASQSVSSSINSTNNQLNSAVNSYDEIERELTDNFKVSVDAIDTNFSWGSGFLNSATFIRSCFDNLVEPEPIYNLLLFALILGFSLFIIGRLR